ncbi:type IV toxin-antitoxin system AbiEi family antitoxin domain-containing protein [Corynebacterium sp. NPDC060344]|uniref:type IV toxin-antitoxin system AbiEi family antitoxin domain-containing protein n=1 Tax=Corynebacterium sp. NPDC060344 TaxID=3347101 RepID=UPI0036697C93
MGGTETGAALPEYGATRSELLAAGWTDRSIRSAIRAGQLVRIGRGWYSTPATIWLAKMSLVMRLNPQAVFSHRTAAWLHGFRQSPPTELDVIVPREVSRLQGAVAHRRDAKNTVVATVHGWRVTGEAQTLADLMAPSEWGAELVATIVDKQFPNARDRAALLAQARELAHPRAGELAELLAWVPEGARSHVERRLARALQRLGFVVVLNYGIGPYRFDLVHVGARLIIEFDSEKYHTDLRTFRYDRARQNLAVRRGWGFLRYHDYDVDQRFDIIVAEIAATIREREGGARVESDWDRVACWELYDDLRQKSDEDFARGMGLFDGRE